MAVSGSQKRAERRKATLRGPGAAEEARTEPRRDSPMEIFNITYTVYTAQSNVHTNESLPLS